MNIFILSDKRCILLSLLTLVCSAHNLSQRPSIIVFQVSFLDSELWQKCVCEFPFKELEGMLPSLPLLFFSTSFHLPKNQQWRGACLDFFAEIEVKINPGEMRWTRPSGKVRRWLTLSCCVVKEKGSEAAGIVGIVASMTTRPQGILGRSNNSPSYCSSVCFFSGKQCRHPT